MGPDKNTGVRPVKVGELDVLLDQLIRDGAGRPLAYVSIGVGGAPSEARSFSSRSGSRQDHESPRGVVVSVEANPVPDKPAEYVVVMRDMDGSLDAWGGGLHGTKVDVRRDIGKVLGGGHGTGGTYEQIRLFLVEPAEVKASDLYYRPEEVLPGRAD